MSDFSYQCFQNGDKVLRLVFLLHGYNSTGKDVEVQAELLSKHLDKTLVVVPEANEMSERNPLKKQWYALADLDPERKRRQTETTIEEIVEIYNKTGGRISKVSKEINAFITSFQKKYKVSNKNTFIMGFSQGAMLAAYTGLTRRHELGGVFLFAGIISGKDKLEEELASSPKVHLFHGTDDVSVQYKTLGFTKEWLDNHDIFWEAVEYEGVNHKLTEEEMLDAAEAINRGA